MLKNKKIASEFDEKERILVEKIMHCKAEDFRCVNGELNEKTKKLIKLHGIMWN